MNTTDFIRTYFSNDEQRIEIIPDIENANTIGRVVCGFLNESGGYVVFNPDNPAESDILDLSDQEVVQLEREIYMGISPKVLVSFRIQRFGHGNGLVIEVPKGKDVPYAFRDIIYLRKGKTTIKADAESIRDIVLRRQIEPERWERRFSLAELDTDINFNEVKSAIDDAQRMRRAFFRDIREPYMVLEDFFAAKYGRITNGGDVLFAKNPAARLPQIRIRAACFNTDQAGDKFSDLKTFEGPLHRIFEEAYTFIVRNTPTIARFIKGNPKRQDSPLYPEDAVREALINALVHRDYSASSGGVSIHIFPRRLEIWNSGPLPEGVTVENLQKGQQLSVLRNPDIAHAIYLRGFMEKAGRGGRLMAQLCKDAGLPPPTWKSDPSGVTVTFRTPDVTAEVERTNLPHLQGVNEIKSDIFTDAGTDVRTDVRTDVEIDVETDVNKLIQSISGAMSRKEIRTRMRLKSDEPFRKNWLRPALKAGLLEMTIPDKPKSVKQRYRLTPKGKAHKARLASARP